MTTTTDIEEQALGWFVRLNDADASSSAWLSFQDWLEADDAHRLAYDAIEQTWVDLDEAPSPPVVIAVAANDAGPARRTGAHRSRPVWLFPAFAAAAALVITVGVWPRINGLNDTQVYTTGAEPRTVELSDGSHIYLNRHSDLTVRMKASSRTVTLADGEAAFDVTHDASRPFIITTGGRDVRVLGTAFNVLSHDGRFSVGVERGVVAVTPSKATAPVRLTAGQKIDQTGSATPVLSQMDPERASSWRQGVLIYRNAALADVANDLSRYLDKPVTVSPTAQPLHFTGALRVGNEATMLDQLQAFVPVRTTRSSTDVRLTARDGS
ncbi:FecR family protein [soil metagenome]